MCGKGKAVTKAGLVVYEGGAARGIKKWPKLDVCGEDAFVVAETDSLFAIGALYALSPSPRLGVSATLHSQ